METITLRESRLTIDGQGIAELTHMRPEQRNPLTQALRDDYVDVVDRLEGDRHVRALILTGSGGSFCAGGDVKTMHTRQADPAATSPDAMRKRIQALHNWLPRLRNLDMPVIAAVDGPAWGGGFAMALSADFILATPRASFCMVFLRIGVIPDMGALYLLPRFVGLQRAKELLMTARRVDAGEARDLGIVLSLHEPDALREAACTLARRFVDAPRLAVAHTKRLANRAYETDAATMAELEGLAQGHCGVEPYHAESVERFVRREPARFDWDRKEG